MPSPSALIAASKRRPPPGGAEGRRASCLVCGARGRTICAPLAAAAIGRVADLKETPRAFPAGAVVYAEGTPCLEYFTVLEGWIALATTLEDGARLVLDFALPGDFFGFQANPAAPRGHAAVAACPARLCTLPRAGVEALIAAVPTVTAHLSHLIAMHEARAHDHLVSSNGRSARARVAHLLIELYFRQRHHLPEAAGETIALPLTLGLIGAAVGLTGEHVSRSLARLRAERVLRLSRQTLTILDPEALIRATGVESHPLADAIGLDA